MDGFGFERGAVAVAIVGDRLVGHEPQDAIETALAHAAEALGVHVDATWHDTRTLERDAAAVLDDADAVWCAPGGPFARLEGALAGIRFAREQRRPFLGTCAGFQHAVIEIARGLLGVGDARHAEYGQDGPASSLFIHELLCSLVGQSMTVRLVDAATRDVYGSPEAVERYYCRFGLNEDHVAALAGVGLVVGGVDATDGTTRIMHLTEHPFFYLTLFVPQTRSPRERPHPIITRYLATALERRGGGVSASPSAT